MPTRLTDLVRARLHDVLTADAGNRLAPVRAARSVLGTLNDLAGRPVCSEEELARRRTASVPLVAKPPARREVAPVVIYFDGKDHRTLRKVEELLKGRDIPYRVLDVADDESTRSYASTQAKSEEFPLVFVAGDAIGGLHALQQCDVNGLLVKKVFGG
jgi:glutaredoxin